LADAVDRLLAILERTRAEGAEGRIGRRDGVISRGESAQVARGPRRGLAIAQRGSVAHLGQHLLDDAADEVFGHLHGGHPCVVESYVSFAFRRIVGWVKPTVFRSRRSVGFSHPTNRIYPAVSRVEKITRPPMSTVSTRPITTASMGNFSVSGVSRALDPWQ